MVAPATLLEMVAAPDEPSTVMTGSGSGNVTCWVVTAEALPLRTVTALTVTGDVALLERSIVPLYTVPLVAVGSVPSRV